MRICSWNINGLRSLRQPLKTVLEQLDSDIICFQETKVTREHLKTIETLKFILGQMHRNFYCLQAKLLQRNTLVLMAIIRFTVGLEFDKAIPV